MIRKAHAEDVRTVSRLHYLAGRHFFSYFFASPEPVMLTMLDRLYATPDTFCSQTFWWVDADQASVKGGIAFYPGAQYDTLAKNIGNYGREIARLAGVGGSLKMLVRGLFHPRMLVMEEDELYVQALAVFPDFRGQGLASGLLRMAFAEAARLELPKVALLVETPNNHARTVYEHHGFRITATQDFVRRFHKHNLYGIHKMVADVVVNENA